MTSNIYLISSIAATVGCGLIGGVFFAFSCFVMRALARLPAAHGIAAMQSINIVVLNPVFLGVFAGTAVLCVGVGIASLANGSRPSSAWMIAGCVLYVLGNVVVTRACSIPRNDVLAAFDPNSAEAARYWTEYLASWTVWNHVRTLTATAAMACLIIGLWLARAVAIAPANS